MQTAGFAELLTRALKRAAVGPGLATHEGKAELLDLWTRYRSGAIAAEVFHAELDASTLAATLREGPTPAPYSKRLVDLFCSHMLECVSAKRSHGRPPGRSEEAAHGARMFWAWHQVEHKRVRNALHLGRAFAEREEHAPLRELVAYAERLGQKYVALELVWLPTVCRRKDGGVGTFIDLLAESARRWDNSLLREGAYEQVALPVSRDELPF